MMSRTEISLTNDELSVLDAEAERTGRSVATLIRGAVQTVYGVKQASDGDLATMRRPFGAWQDHDVDGAELVDRLRAGSRLPRIW